MAPFSDLTKWCQAPVGTRSDGDPESCNTHADCYTCECCWAHCLCDQKYQLIQGSSVQVGNVLSHDGKDKRIQTLEPIRGKFKYGGNWITGRIAHFDDGSTTHIFDNDHVPLSLKEG